MHGMVWYGMVWYGMMHGWYGAWNDAWMVWYGMVWYGMMHGAVAHSSTEYGNQRGSHFESHCTLYWCCIAYTGDAVDYQVVYM